MHDKAFQPSAGFKIHAVYLAIFLQSFLSCSGCEERDFWILPGGDQDDFIPIVIKSSGKSISPN